MPTFFPRHTVELHIEEPKAFRKLSYSLVEMAIVTGVIVRIYRVLALTHGCEQLALRVRRHSQSRRSSCSAW